MVNIHIHIHIMQFRIEIEEHGYSIPLSIHHVLFHFYTTFDSFYIYLICASPLFQEFGYFIISEPFKFNSPAIKPKRGHKKAIY
jgi:hypothetical protein